MRYRRFQPLARDLSVLVLGTANWEFWPREHVDELVDVWLAAGGNAFDSGRHYGASERILAESLRGRRDEAVLLTKGAHHAEDYEGGPILRRRVTAEDIAHDLRASLEALATDAVDVYMLHRDDPGQPVGPIVDALNEHKRADRIRALGASNWTTARLEEANAYAAAHALDGFSCSSVNLSLATQNEPPWREAVSAHDTASLAWYERTQLPLFAWSAQAAGFFAGYVDARVYGSGANEERLRRATQLGDTTGFTANQVALAWVLHQPFPTYAIIGPRSVEELRTSVEALDLHLTREQVCWLDLEEDGWQG